MPLSSRVLCVGVLLAATAPALAQSDGFLLFTDPGGYYSIEFPRDWRWTIVAGSREPMAMFVQQRSEAAIIVERSRMRQRLAAADITEVFANIEVDSLKETQPRISGVTARIETWGSSRVIVIDYTRPGGAENERVRQYSFPVAQELYRVTCMALVSRFTRYEPSYAMVARSLKVFGLPDSSPTVR